MARSKDFLLSLAALAKEGNETALRALEAIGTLRSGGAMFDADSFRKRAGKALAAQKNSLLWGIMRGQIASARLAILSTAVSNPSPALESDLDGIYSVPVRQIRQGKRSVPSAFSPEGEKLRALLLLIAPGGAKHSTPTQEEEAEEEAEEESNLGDVDDTEA